MLRNSARIAKAVLVKRRQGRLWTQEQTNIALLAQHRSTTATKLAKQFYKHYGNFGRLAVLGKRAHSDYAQASKTSAISASDYLASQLKLTANQAVLPYNSGLTLLASIAASAPFIGLFGTVWGIYKTLMNLASEQAISMQNIAGPIGEALIVTALGLVVAIPALLAYNLLLRQSKKMQSELNHFAQQWHNYLLTDILPAELS
ncbi:MAG: MotA/TolQ/ExbB proton channel family protein [Colwellia sp.]|nr:MotA/TolQ/ExbB proton channel family protein [Colwellia sp.]